MRTEVAVVATVLLGGLASLFLLTRSQGSRQPDDLPPTEGKDELPAPAGPGGGIERQDYGQGRAPGVERQTQADSRQGITGFVLSQTGGPVVGARLQLIRPAATEDLFARILGGGQLPAPLRIAQASSGKNGSFRLPAPAGVFRLTVGAPDHVEETQRVRVTSGSFRALEPIVLDRGRTLVGTVRNGRTQEAVAGALVRARATVFGLGATIGRRQHEVEARTDGSGRYELRGLAAVPFELTATAPGFARLMKRGLGFEPGERSRSLDLELAPGTRISGRVMDTAGEPLSGALVRATSLAPEATTHDARSSAEGLFRIDGLERGDYVVMVRAAGHVASEKKPIASPADDLEFRLDAKGRVRVRVLGADGQSIARFRLCLRRHLPGDRLGRTQHPPRDVDAPSRDFELGGIDPGRYVLEIEAQDYAKTFSDPFEVTADREPPVLVQVRMSRGGSLAGFVTDPADRPLAGATVTTLAGDSPDHPFLEGLLSFVPQRVSKASVRTDAQGRFRLLRLAPGGYKLRVEHPAHPSAYRAGLRVVAGEQHDAGTIRLPAGGTLQGLVFWQGKPAAAFEVSVARLDSLQRTASGKTTTDARGRFKLARRLAAGRYEVRAMPRGMTGLEAFVFLQKCRQEVVVRDGIDARVTLTID